MIILIQNDTIQKTRNKLRSKIKIKHWIIRAVVHIYIYVYRYFFYYYYNLVESFYHIHVYRILDEAAIYKQKAILSLRTYHSVIHG